MIDGSAVFSTTCLANQRSKRVSWLAKMTVRTPNHLARVARVAIVSGGFLWQIEILKTACH